jgi:hypothetical protein
LTPIAICAAASKRLKTNNTEPLMLTLVCAFALLVIGAFHIFYWLVLICGGMQILNNLQSSGKSRETPPASTPVKKPPPLMANGHSAQYNRLIARGKELGL